MDTAQVLAAADQCATFRGKQLFVACTLAYSYSGQLILGDRGWQPDQRPRSPSDMDLNVKYVARIPNHTSLPTSKAKAQECDPLLQARGRNDLFGGLQAD